MPQDVANILMQIVPFALIIVVFYFLLIRPQRKKDKEVKSMLSNLKVGDRIATIGGLYGNIAAIKDDVLTLTVGPEKVKIMVARWAIRSLESTPEGSENDLI
ncbi:MAG: preprotein translocase subunit YajC [Christensenellaceae bacterium]|jgi:preprotein translocase subunit YajC|nr:preprotein translocase subunit YajC [Christensenellaceae bacterium]